MTAPPDPSHTIRGWVARAEQDFRNAELTIAIQEDCPLDTVCFHAQQCVEKYLKALLIHRGVEHLKSHNLELLAGQFSPCPELGVETRELSFLTRFAIESRYPGDWDPSTRAEAEKCLATARKVRLAVRALLPQEVLNQEIRPGGLIQ